MWGPKFVRNLDTNLALEICSTQGPINICRGTILEKGAPALGCPKNAMISETTSPLFFPHAKTCIQAKQHQNLVQKLFCLYAKVLLKIFMLFCLYAKQLLHKILMLFGLYAKVLHKILMLFCLYAKQLLHKILMLFCLYTKQILHKILILWLHLAKWIVKSAASRPISIIYS